MDIDIKFKVGDTVYNSNPTMTSKQHPCPDCKGSRKWTATSPAGIEYSFKCPRCSAHYTSNRSVSLNYSAWTPSATKLTIGSIRLDTNDDEPVEYMCEETGVGSGTIYKQCNLHSSEAEALAASQERAEKMNAKTPHIVDAYNQSLSVCDYELSNALIEDAKKIKFEAESAIRDAAENHHDVLNNIEMCVNIDQVMQIVRSEQEKAEA